MFFDSKNSSEDDFWNLDEFVPKKKNSYANTRKQFSSNATSAVEIEVDRKSENVNSAFTEVQLSKSSKAPNIGVSESTESNGTITRFIPPHSDSAFAKKHVISEYVPNNPLIKSVKIFADKPDEKIFVSSNLFMRERRALLHRKAQESPHMPYYSYSPRYSQMSRGQLNWYLWWRENTRNGIYLKTDESYLILYAYELAATEDGEDKQSSLYMLCSLLREYTEKDINVVFRMMIRDLICDFCLLHGLPSPIDKLKGQERSLLANAFLPEFFLDFSEELRDHTIDFGLSSLSMYDYKRSKYFTPENKEVFDKAMQGALSAVMTDDASFHAVTSFTSGMYGCTTVERRPFARMINIVNRNVKFEITYYHLSNVQAVITDAVRYAENKLREHLGIKNKLHVMSVNPQVRSALDRFFAQYYPAQPVIDRRRKNAADSEQEVHEYDKLYDVPKTEISPERAIEIERESWNTTKILTEAFADEDDLAITVSEETPATATITIESEAVGYTDVSPTPVETYTDGLFDQIKAHLGILADLIPLCKQPDLLTQRQFAVARGLSLDELADRINECAVEVFGDVLLEDAGGYYAIIDDYLDQL